MTNAFGERGRVGECYNVGGNTERTNIEIVNTICDVVDRLRPRPGEPPRRELITFVKDRPGHDRRYAIDASKITGELGWTPQHDFDSAIELTVRWYIENTTWVNRVLAGEYRLERLGLKNEETA